MTPAGADVRPRFSWVGGVAGREVPTDRALGKWAFGFRFYGAPADGIEVRLQLDQRAEGVTIRGADSTHDLGVVPGFLPPPQGRVLVTPEWS
jgi:hypothetical protein